MTTKNCNTSKEINITLSLSDADISLVHDIYANYHENGLWDIDHEVFMSYFFATLEDSIISKLDRNQAATGIQSVAHGVRDYE